VASHRPAFQHPDQRAAEVVDAPRRGLLDPRGQPGGRSAAERGQQEKHVHVEPGRAQHVDRRGDQIGEEAGQGRGDREAEAARRGEGRQVKGTAAARSQADRQIHRRDAMPAPQGACQHCFDDDRP
jgi:hypothetical protein